MKTNLIVLLIALSMLSCKKDLIPYQSDPLELYKENVRLALRDSMPSAVYQLLAFDKLQAGKTARSRYFARIPIEGSERKWVRVITDSTGKVLTGNIIQITNLESKVAARSKTGHISASIYTSALNGQQETRRDINKQNVAILRSEYPKIVTDEPETDPDPDKVAGEQWLPDFILVCTSDKSDPMPYVLDMAVSWDFPELTYADYFELPPQTAMPATNYVEIEVYRAPPPPVDIKKIFDCFALMVSSYGNAKYSIKIAADVPVNMFPGMWCNLNGSPGHTFLEITKSNGSSSVTQVIGYYPGDDTHGAIIRNDEGREINASLEMNITEEQFNTIQANALAYAETTYHVGVNNCTDFALNVINSIRSTPIETVDIPVYSYSSDTVNPLPESVKHSPQALYYTLKDMKDANGADANAIKIDNSSNTKAKESNGCKE